MKVGFTMIEVILVMALAAVLIAIAVPTLGGLAKTGFINSELSSVEQLAYKARSFSQHGKNDGRWGVYANGSSVTLFNGNTYTTRDSLQDEEVPLTTITIAQSEEILFDPLDGSSTSGSISFMENGTVIATLTFQEQGIIEWQP